MNQFELPRVSTAPCEVLSEAGSEIDRYEDFFRQLKAFEDKVRDFPDRHVREYWLQESAVLRSTAERGLERLRPRPHAESSPEFVSPVSQRSWAL